MRAVRTRQLEAVNLLLENGAKVYATNNDRDNVLHLAIRARSKVITEYLLSNPKHSQLLYRPNKKGDTPYRIDLNYKDPIIEEIFGAGK